MALSGSFSGSIYNGHYRLRVDWSASQSVTNNTSTITANMYLERDYSLNISGRTDNSTTIDGTSLTYSSPSISGSSGGTTHLGSVSRTVSHNADGTKSLTISSVFNIRATLSGTYYGSISASANITLDTIPRTSSVSGGTGNIEGTSTINISRASGSFTHTLYFSFGTISWQHIASNVGTSYTWTLPSSMYAQIPNANSGVGTIHCETYYNGTYIGTSSCSFTAKVVNANPSFSSSKVTYKDNNTTTTNVTQNNQKLVQNLSNLLVTIASATAQKSASITKYEATINNVTKTITSAGNIDFGVINSGSDLTLSVKVTDSRGNSTTVSKTVTFLAWSLPTAIISLKRKNNYEDESYLTVDGSYSSVDNKNTLTIKYQKKKSTDSSYSSLITISDNVRVTITNDKNYVWNYKIVLTDKFGTTTYNVNLPKGRFILFVDTKKLSVGINGFPTKNESLEVNGKTIFDLVYPVGSIYMSMNSTDPSTLFGGTWQRITGGFLYGCVNSSGVGNGTGTSTGGASGNTGSTTLSIDQIPNHSHLLKMRNAGKWDWSSGSASGDMMEGGYSWNANSTTYNWLIENSYVGGGKGHTHSLNSHTHVVPYIAVFCWKRTA